MCGSLVPVPARLGRAESRRWSRVPGRRFVGCGGFAERDAEPLQVRGLSWSRPCTRAAGRKFQSYPGVPQARLIDLVMPPNEILGTDKESKILHEFRMMQEATDAMVRNGYLQEISPHGHCVSYDAWKRYAVRDSRWRR
jgi:hypothetical protein